MKKILASILFAVLLCTNVQSIGKNAEGPAVPSGGEGVAKKLVALTFDDGPTGKTTEALLDGLRARYVPATFFLCGYRIEEFPDVVQRIAEEGHEIAIHGKTHSYLNRMDPAQIQEELQSTAVMVEELTGTRPVLLRPPGGLTSETLQTEAARENLALIFWSVDPEDWNVRDANAVTSRILKKAGDGDIILMHDLYRSSVQAALAVIDRMQAEGYQFCTVSELAAAREVELTPGNKYYKFPREQFES